MADWNLPTITSGYINFVTEMNNKFVDAATLQFTVGSNIPLQTIRWNRSSSNFQEWLGPASGWQDKLLSIAGGGTGSNNLTGIRNNLGLGSMATQNSNAVNITGGTVVGVTYSASDITSGVLSLARGGTGSSLTLAAEGYPLISTGGILQFSQGINISTLNASNLTVGTVPAARLSGVSLLAGSNIYTGVNRFEGNVAQFSPIGVQGPYPSYQFYDTLGITNLHWLRLLSSSGGFYVQRLTDDWATSISNLFIDSSGIVTCYGGAITNLNANNITDGIVNPARLGSGVANSTTFLRGDGTWQVVTSGTPGETIPSGLIALFDTNCPAGWTRVAALDNRFPIGGTSYGTSGGSTSHQHSIGLNTSIDGKHDHNFSESGTTGVNDSSFNSLAGKEAISITIPSDGHRHSFSISGRTDQNGDHNHQVSGNVSTVDQYPPYLTVVYCRKN